MAKSWNNWSIDTDDEDISISGDSSSYDKVSITFSSGNVVDARTYIITYNDGQRCVSFRYYVSDTSSTCDCSSLVFHGTEEQDPPQEFSINVSVKNSTFRYNIPSSGGTYTAATLDSECEIENQISVSGNTIFNEIVTPSSIVFDGTNLVFTAKASQATSEREGYAEVNYTIHGNECKKYIHLVQEAPPTPKATLRLSNGTTVTVPCNGDSELKRNEMTSLVTASDVVSVHVEDCVTKIGDYAFKADEFTSLTSITMADSVTEIGESVHETSYGSTNLKTITFSSNLASIGDGAFWGCSKLTSINLPNGLKTIGNDAFRSCSGLTKVTLPDSVTTLGGLSFHNCAGITEFTFGTGFTGITSPGQCLQYTNLTKVTCKAVRPPVIDDYMFCSSLSDACVDRFRVYVPRNSVSAYEQANGWSRYYIDDDGF